MRVAAATFVTGVALAGKRHGFAGPAHHMPAGGDMTHEHMDHHEHHAMPPHDPAMNVEGAHPMPHDETMPEPYIAECHEGEVLCMEDAPADCADCMPYSFCSWGSSCPPPPLMCDWDSEMNCWENDGTEWGTEFCASWEQGCPITCFDSDIKCHDDWGQFCMPMEDGCPPPPANCDWEFEMHCWEDNGTIFSNEFCAPLDTGCPITCSENEMSCADEWGEFCVNMEYGCPPPMSHCDWDFEMPCWEDDGTYWGVEFCSPKETGCPMMDYYHTEAEVDATMTNAPYEATHGYSHAHRGFAGPKKVDRKTAKSGHKKHFKRGKKKGGN